MSEFDETFDQKYLLFADTLYNVCYHVGDDRRILSRVMEAVRYTPDKVADLLEITAKAKELEAEIDSTVRWEQDLIKGDYLAEECVRMRTDAARYRELIPLWEEVLDASDYVQNVPAMVRGFHERNDEMLFLRRRQTT